MSNERVISFKDFFSIDEKKLKKKEIESLFDVNELEKIHDLEIDSETLLFESEIKVQDSEFISENLFCCSFYKYSIPALHRSYIICATAICVET